MNKNKGFVGILVAIVVALVIAGAGTYFVLNKKTEVEENPKVNVEEKNNSTGIKSDIIFSISGNTLLVVENGKTTQTISLSKDAIEVISQENNSIKEQRFITDQDVNFDGHADVGVLTGVGYSGVNVFYDYYLFNPDTKKLEKSLLLQISNFKVDKVNKKIISSFRSGPQWYSQTFQWNGSSFLKSDAKLEVPANSSVSSQEFADWKTYDSGRGFSFKYPSIWSVYATTDSSVGDIFYILKPNQNKNNLAGVLSFHIYKPKYDMVWANLTDIEKYERGLDLETSRLYPNIKPSYTRSYTTLWNEDRSNNWLSIYDSTQGNKNDIFLKDAVAYEFYYNQFHYTEVELSEINKIINSFTYIK